MRCYYPNLSAIEQQTRQLEQESCRHCGQTHQLVSHGFVYKKRTGGEPEAVGKRVFCSNRRRRTGCGRTMQLYLDATVRYLHYAGSCVVAFALALMTSVSVRQAYCQATGAFDDRHAYRWLNRLVAHIGGYRMLTHRPLLLEPVLAAPKQPARRQLLASTFQGLLRRFGAPLCAQYQRHTQRSFL
jgi:hypothetical protein